MTFKTGMLSTFVLLATSMAGAQSPMCTADIESSMLIFRNFEQLGRAEKASLLKQTAVLHLEVREGQNKAEIILRRTQDVTNMEHGIIYDMIPSNIDVGDKHLIARMSYAWNAELGRYNQCRTDKIFCETLSVSEKNYIVTPLAQEQLNGTDVIHFSLKPRKQYEGMVKGEIWINSQTSHVVRETGSAVALSKFVTNNSYDRTYTEVNGEVVPLRQAYHVSALMIGTFDAVYDYSEVRNIRAPVSNNEMKSAAVPGVDPVSNPTAGPANGGAPLQDNATSDIPTAAPTTASAPATPVPSPSGPHRFISRLKAIFSHLK